MESEISILIIEDEALIAQNIKMQLESFGYNIAGVYYKFNAALKAIEELDYDLVITDINLGDGIDEKSGIRLAERLRQTKSCPLIFLTAFSDKNTLKKAAASSPSAYLVKPINAVNLFAAVQLAVQNFASQSNAVPETNERPDYFFVKQGNSLLKIFWKDVYHLEYVKNYVKIRSTEQQAAVLVRSFLSKFIDTMLPSEYKNDFIKINRGEIISKKIITKVDKEFVETSFGKFKIGLEFDKSDL